MNEIDFRNWMINRSVPSKVIGDIISRLKRIEREIGNCDIDEQYRSDNCKYLLSIFANNGENNEMKQYPNANFPIGKYYMSTYRYALKKYIQFLEQKL